LLLLEDKAKYQYTAIAIGNVKTIYIEKKDFHEKFPPHLKKTMERDSKRKQDWIYERMFNI